MVIKDLEYSSRPREKCLKNGISSLKNEELLAIIIRCGTKENSALDIGNAILNKYQTLTKLLSCDIYDLMKIKGIKKAKAIEICAVIELAKRVSLEEKSKMDSIANAEDIYKMYKIELESEKQEKFIVMFLTIKLKIIKSETLFIGGENTSIVDINLIFKKALSCGARRIICIHNHPSGDSSPSKEDVNLTNKIRRIGEIANIELVDHIIIGKDNYFSFKQNDC